MTKKQISFFNVAKTISDNSDYSPHKIGCIVVYKGRIMSTGYNTNKTNPTQKTYNKYRKFDTDKYPAKTHAEISALSKFVNSCYGLDINWKQVEIYIFRQHKNGTLALAKPCTSCMSYIKHLGIKHIHYTGNDSYIHEQLI